MTSLHLPSCPLIIEPTIEGIVDRYRPASDSLPQPCCVILHLINQATTMKEVITSDDKTFCQQATGNKDIRISTYSKLANSHLFKHICIHSAFCMQLIISTYPRFTIFTPTTPASPQLPSFEKEKHSKIIQKTQKTQRNRHNIHYLYLYITPIPL